MLTTFRPPEVPTGFRPVVHAMTSLSEPRSGDGRAILIVSELLRSFDYDDRDTDDKVTALCALCAVLGRALVVGGVIRQADLDAAVRSVRAQLPPDHAGLRVLDEFLAML
jgi:hypothetical protein